MTSWDAYGRLSRGLFVDMKHSDIRLQPSQLPCWCCGVLLKFSTFGSQKCYLRRRIRSKTPAGRSQKFYFGEGIGPFRAQKSAISGETFAGASRGLLECFKYLVPRACSTFWVIFSVRFSPLHHVHVPGYALVKLYCYWYIWILRNQYLV